MRSRDQRRVLQKLGELRYRLPEGNARGGSPLISYYAEKCNGRGNIIFSLPGRCHGSGRSPLISYFYRKCNGQFPASRTEHVNMKKRISDRSAAKERFENT